MSVNQDEQEDRIRPDAQQEQLPFLEIPTMSESYGQVAGAAVSLECFVPAYAEAWFRKAEAKFADCNVTREHTKYRKVLQALPVEMISKLHAFLEDDPLKGKAWPLRRKSEWDDNSVLAAEWVWRSRGLRIFLPKMTLSMGPIN